MKRILLPTIAALVLLSCGGSTSNKQATTETKSADVTEVLYFHGKKRCITCNAIEKLTKEVVGVLVEVPAMLMLIRIANNRRKNFKI